MKYQFTVTEVHLYSLGSRLVVCMNTADRRTSVRCCVHLVVENSGDSVFQWRSTTYRPQDNGVIEHSGIN